MDDTIDIPKQENNFYEKLKQYFEETPREKVLEDWAKSAEYDKVGPTVDDFLNNTNKQETIEEAGLKHCDMLDKFPALVNPLFSFKKGAKWQQERMYSEEDMINFAFDTYHYISELMKVPFNLISENKLHAMHNFKQFKKK
jgi:hypothetical protein